MNRDAEKPARDLVAESLAKARQVLAIEARSVLDLADRLDDNFVMVIDLIMASPGKVVFMGMGKSGLVARKLAATFASLGTPAFFVHAGEARHGDLGMISGDDVLIMLSNSGETEELIALLPSLRRIGPSAVLITGNLSSSLARYSDVCLFAGVRAEACAIGLAPTASTTAAMALGDALAIALSEIKGFSPDRYAVFHPGGSLGRKLLITVEDVMNIRRQNPVVGIESSVKEALLAMTESKMGATSVVNGDGLLAGVVTDGDIRRRLENAPDLLDQPVRSCMTHSPLTIDRASLGADALRIMEQNEIKDLPVVEHGRPVGMFNIQDLLWARVL